MSTRKAGQRGGHNRQARSRAIAEVPVVGGREPCPCGSGRRYKSCHGKAAAAAAAVPIASRPFEGFATECDWVALRELVPAATAPLKLLGEHADRTVTLATVLPLAAPAVHRDTGEILVALQTLSSSGDPNRDVAEALVRALESEPGDAIEIVEPSADTPKLQELVDVSVPLEVTVHEGFGFWMAPDAELNAETSAALDRANAAAHPTARLSAVDAAYWTRIREKCHVRWAMPYEEDALLDALARLHAAGESSLGEGTRYVGAFRADGLVVPVWDLPVESEAADAEKPAAAFAERLEKALARTGPLTDAERRARAGLVSRQLTLR